jgi:hypothetical protein
MTWGCALALTSPCVTFDTRSAAVHGEILMAQPRDSKCSTTREQYEAHAGGLIGEVLRRVRYFEIDHQGTQGAWAADIRFDSLDFGLDLLMESGKFFTISWGAEFHPYGISFDTPLDSKGARVTDVSELSGWRRMLGKRIVDARIVWSWVEGSDLGRVYYPQDLVLCFDDRTIVYVSAIEVRHGLPLGMADHITVFFDARTAKQFGVGQVAASSSD